MLPTPSTLTNTQATAARVRPELLRLLDGLPQPKHVELLNFARFLREQAMATTDAAHSNSVALHTVPASTLVDLTGLVGLGGDAVLDTEALYDGV